MLKTNKDLQELLGVLRSYYKKKDQMLNVECITKTSNILKNKNLNPETHYEKMLLEMFDKVEDSKKIETFQKMMTTMEQLSMVLNF